MERSEPTFVPEWLKNSGSLSTTPHQFQSSSLHSDEKGVSKTTRNKSFVNINGNNDSGRPSVSEKTTSSYFRRTSSNGSSHLRSYSSFGRNNRDRDRDRDKEKSTDNSHSHNRHGDYSDPLSNILPTRFEKEGLRRSHSSVSSKRESSWPRKVVPEKNNHNNGGRVIGSGNVKIAFERDFPSLGAEEKQVDGEIGRVPSPGLTTAIQSLPIGNAAVIGGDGWTSALAEVPVIVGTNGSNNTTTSVQSTSVPVSSTTIVTTGRNMAETLSQGPPRVSAAPQLSVGTQRLEELAVKQSRQLIPMTPSLPKALGLNSSDKQKPKGAQLQLQNSHIVNHSQSPRSSASNTTKVDISNSKTSSTSVGKLHVLKPSRERNNGVSPVPKDSLSPTGGGGGGKLPNSPLAVPSVVVGPAPLKNNNNPVAEKRPSSQAQSRIDFFNLMRKKSLTSNNAPVETVTPDDTSSSDKDPVVEGSGGVQESKVEMGCNGDVDTNAAENGKNDGILYSEEEEARFLRSLGWEDTTEEEEGLTEEEISSFYRDVSKYLNLQAASKILKGTQTKLLMPLHSQMVGKNGDISSDSKLES